ncbi:MFS transporter [Actinoplanes regularis]|uniref:Predicted arabinose efflux permease, MFS family n=1 Tax=Actinoplanes regularis TaxID=52697 RepID=A0A238YBL8_9ACTN|nr:MFS transporter [Actinoplanes regularis]GIE86044.1 MFS transporter [Actinoplanes regularis]SNR68141.1 Predicted arabinose efflux permease, MFS family [Actinoplanes regularis]
MLRTPGLLALFTAKLLSTFGSWLTLLALPWFVLVTTGSPVKMSLVLTAEFVGVVTVGLVSGKLVALLGARRVMLIGDASRAPLMASIPLLHLAGALNLPILLAVSFGLGMFTAPYVASQRLILPELLGPVRGADEHLLGRANSLIDAATRMAALAGPAAGGILIASLGPAQVLWIDAATYLGSFLIVLTFVRPHPTTLATDPGERPASGNGRPTRSSGFRQVLNDPTLRLFGAALTLVTLALPAVFLCLPVLVLHDLGGDPRTLGLLTTANGAGLALGSLIAVTALSRMGTTALTAAAALLCVPLWLLLVEQPIIIGAGLFLTGVATPVLAATLITHFTLRTPPDLRPHVLAAVTTTENLAGFIGSVAAGPALQFAGPRTVFTTIAILACAGAAMFVKGLRDRITRPAPLGRHLPAQSTAERT